MSITPIIRRCIDRCAARNDDRGRWQAERDCAAAIVNRGGDAKIAADVAAAARRIGTWLRGAA